LLLSYQKLKFHQRLAPYKLGMMINGEDTRDLTVVADYIKDELRKETILIQTNINSLDSNR